MKKVFEQREKKSGAGRGFYTEAAPAAPWRRSSTEGSVLAGGLKPPHNRREGGRLGTAPTRGGAAPAPGGSKPGVFGVRRKIPGAPSFSRCCARGRAHSCIILVSDPRSSVE